MRKILHILLSIFFVLQVLNFNFVYASSNREVSVEVKDQDDDGVGGINITLSGPNTYTPNTITTSSNGTAIFDDLESNGEYTATISLPSSSDWKLASGQSGSKSVQITNSNQKDTIEFTITKKQADEETTPKILEITLPPTFTKSGSLSTNLSKIKASDVDSVENFTLDDPSANKIVFLVPIDLSDDALAEKFGELDKYVSLSEEGRIFVDSADLPMLNKKAQITMKGLSLTNSSTPIIIEDGEKSTKVSNIKYLNGILTFDVSGFSSYAFKPTLKVEAPEDVAEASYTINGEVNDLDAKIDIYLGEERIAQEIEPDDAGKFVFSYNLTEKDNSFKVVASSQNGEASDVSFEVNFSGGEENKKDSSQNSTLLIILLVIGALVVVGVVVFIVAKSKKKSLKQPKTMGEQDLDTPNPPMSMIEKEEIAGTRIGETDLTPISETDTDAQ